MEDEQELELRVTDTGVGIPEEDLDYIFDRFYRSNVAKAQATDGSGLGLAISKKMLELQDSSLVVKSEVGKGSCFSFALPKASR